MADERDPLEQLLELTVYAPVGLWLLAREQLPGLVERGRGQVLGQVRLARFIGQFAVAKGRQEVTKRFSSTAAPTPAAETAAAETAASPTPSPVVAPVESPIEPAADPLIAAAGPVAPALDEVVVVIDDAAGAPAGADGPLPIDGYDALAASQVLPRLAALGAGDLEGVRRYEVAHRNRRTVLARIAQLQATAS